MTQPQTIVGSRGPKPRARALIVEAAFEIVSTLGVAGANVDNIARRAGVSRPTVYKYFPNGKSDIVDHLSVAEAENVHSQIKASLTHGKNFPDTLTDALFLTVRFAGNNPFIRRVTESYEVSQWPRESDSEMVSTHRGWWQNLVVSAKERGEIAEDLSVDEVISWLTVIETTLLTWMSGSELTDAMLRRLIRRFYVDPLLAGERAGAGRLRNRSTKG